MGQISIYVICITEQVLYTVIHTNNEERYEIPISSYTNQ
jgi:hypothetical protein